MPDLDDLRAGLTWPLETILAALRRALRERERDAQREVFSRPGTPPAPPPLGTTPARFVPDVRLDPSQIEDRRLPPELEALRRQAEVLARELDDQAALRELEEMAELADLRDEPDWPDEHARPLRPLSRGPRPGVQVVHPAPDYTVPAQHAAQRERGALEGYIDRRWHGAVQAFTGVVAAIDLGANGDLMEVQLEGTGDTVLAHYGGLPVTAALVGTRALCLYDVVSHQVYYRQGL